MTAVFNPRDHPRGPDGQFQATGRPGTSLAQEDRLRAQAAALADETTQRLAVVAEECGLADGDLGDEIFNLKVTEAGAINDAGVHAQVEFLGLNPASEAWREPDLELQVIDAKSEEAARLIDDGLDAQLQYLAASLGAEEAERTIRAAASARIT